ncbi:MAG: SCP2 sterol-binding domain-containing protein [Candidatus Geothermincolia bacterium]
MANLKYLSPEWTEEAKKRLQEELTPEKVNNISSSMVNIYQNCPDGVDRFFYVKFVDGKMDAFEIGTGEPPTAEFKITADYDTFAKITKAELSAIRAITGRKIHLRGNMAKGLKLAPLVDKFNKVLAKIPTDF